MRRALDIAGEICVYTNTNITGTGAEAPDDGLSTHATGAGAARRPHAAADRRRSSIATSSARRTQRRPSRSRCATAGGGSVRRKRSATRSRRTTSSSIGPTGVGKTEIARRLAKLAGAPFVKVEASKFTEVGYVGRDVESMVRDLVESAIDMVRDEREAEVEELAQRARRRAAARSAAAVPPTAGRPPPPPTDAQRGPGAEHDPVFFVSGERQRRRKKSSVARERYQRTRDKLKQLLLDGKLEDREVEIEVTQSAPMMFDMMVPQGAPEGMENFSDMLQDMMPKRKKKRTVQGLRGAPNPARRGAREADRSRKTSPATRSSASSRWASSSSTRSTRSPASAARRGGPDVSREGVQRDLLPIVEGSNVADQVRQW